MAFLGLRSDGAVANAEMSSAPLAPQHFHPPSPRELRAQAVHRLQIGLLGLAGMLLLVGLANIIMDRARVNDDATGAASAAANVASAVPTTAAKSPASDPLADMGVVPDLPAASPEPAPAAPPAPAKAGTVPPVPQR